MNILREIKNQQGMTLIEILIAMVLGSFLLGGVYKIFLGSNQNYRLQENLSRIQESGRFAMEFISRDVRMADFRGCYTTGSVAGAISGTEGATDSITVTRVAGTCAAPVNQSLAYTIQNFTYPDGTVVPTLYRNTNGVGAVALIEGIEDMQILYGEDTDADGTPNHYVDADGGDGVGPNVVNMANVVSVRISLLVHSLSDRLTSQPLGYYFNGIVTTPPTTDRRLRRVFTSTIGIRNRV